MGLKERLRDIYYLPIEVNKLINRVNKISTSVKQLQEYTETYKTYTAILNQVTPLGVITVTELQNDLYNIEYSSIGTPIVNNVLWTVNGFKVEASMPGTFLAGKVYLNASALSDEEDSIAYTALFKRMSDDTLTLEKTEGAGGLWLKEVYVEIRVYN